MASVDDCRGLSYDVLASNEVLDVLRYDDLHTVVLSDTLCKLIHKVERYRVLRIDKHVRLVDCHDDLSVRVVFEVEITVFDNFIIKPFENEEHLRVGNDSVLVGKKALEVEHCKVFFDGKDISDKDYPIKELRSRVGLVFQYPEHQLFEATVFDDVCFGPKNQGCDKKEAELRAFAALKQTGIDESLFYQSPFDLSGGQKRRVAIAGVLAMKPEVLILDEPTAGLDPKGRDEILELIKDLHDSAKITVILVSHSMDDVANYVDRILVMNKGSLIYDAPPKEVFKHVDELEAMGLAIPQVSYAMHALKKAGFDVSTDITTIDEAVREILGKLKK